MMEVTLVCWIGVLSDSVDCVLVLAGTVTKIRIYSKDQHKLFSLLKMNSHLPVSMLCKCGSIATSC